MREGTADLDGRTLAYAEHGDLDGRPVVFHHGFPGSRLAGAFLAEEARRRGVRIVAPERPGVGGSSPRPGRTIADHARETLALADRLGIGSFAAAGLSGGAPYALAVHLAAPERVRRVILVSALPPPGSPGLREGMAALQRAFYAAALEAPRPTGAVLAAAAALAQHAPGLYLRLSTAGSAEPDRRTLRGTEAGRLVAADFAAAFRADGRNVVEDLRVVSRPWGFEPGDVRVPLVAFHGADDRVVPVEAARSAYEGLTVVAAEGHFSLVANRAAEIVAATTGGAAAG